MADFLVSSGVSPNAIGDAKGLPEGSANNFRLIEFPGQQQWLVESALDITSLSVDEAVDRFESLAMSQTVTVATDVIVDDGSGLSTHLEDCVAVIQRVQLVGQAIALRFEGNSSPVQAPVFLLPPDGIPFHPDIESATSPPPPPGPPVSAQPALDVSQTQQRDRDCSFVANLRATTTQLQMPSLYELIFLSSRDESVRDLQANTELLGRLRAVYGGVKLGLAQEIAAEDFTQAYKSIDVFGFSLSTRRFSLAILVLYLLTVMAIAWTVESARRTSTRVISGADEEDVADIALDTPFLRAVVWIGLPALALAASLTLYPFSGFERVVLVTGSLLTVLLAVVATLRARVL